MATVDSNAENIIVDDNKSNKFKPSWLVYMAACCAQLSSLSFGMTMGWTSIANEELDGNFTTTNANDHWKSPIQPNELEKQLIASIWTLGSILGGFCCGYLIDRFGRRKILIILGIPFGMAWLMIGLARSSSIIIIGRVLNGVGVGVSMATVPRYLAEISTPKIRGYIGMTIGYFAGSGMFLINILNIFEFHWNHLGFWATIPTTLMMITMFFMPESPVWCVNFIQDKNDAQRQTEHNLRRLRTIDSDIQQEIDDIIEMKQKSDKTNTNQLVNDSIIRSIR
ncbi:hypothetical protein BLA29_008423, partial [Euroglyphus maynei]